MGGGMSNHVINAGNGIAPAGSALAALGSHTVGALGQAAQAGDQWAQRAIDTLAVRPAPGPIPSMSQPAKEGYGHVLDDLSPNAQFVIQGSQAMSPSLLVDNMVITNYDGPTEVPFSREAMAVYLNSFVTARGGADLNRAAGTASPISLTPGAGRRFVSYGFHIEWSSPLDSSNPTVTATLNYSDAELVARAITMEFRPVAGQELGVIRCLTGRASVNGTPWLGYSVQSNGYIITGAGALETATTTNLTFSGGASNSNGVLEGLSSSSPATRSAKARFLAAATPIGATK